MTQVEMKFTGHADQFNAKPGDVKKVDSRYVARLITDGIAQPTNKSEEEKAKA